MSMRLSVLIDANGKAAITEVAQVGNAVDKLGKTSETSAKSGTKLKASTKGVSVSAGQAKLSVQQLTAEQIKNAQATDQLAAANRQAAHASSQMFAQSNDVFVMIAAGQAPLQTGIQQGFQMAQALGPLGAAGAAKALAGGIAQMLSPITFLTIGTIAATSALVQWATSGSNAAGEVADAITDVEETLTRYIDLQQAAGNAGAVGFDQTQQQLALTSQAYRDLIAIAKIDAFKSVNELNASLVASVVSASYLKTQMGDVGDLLDLETQLQGNVTSWKANREQVSGFIGDLEALGSAVGLNQQYAAALRIRDVFKDTVDVNGDLTDQQLEFWRSLSQSIQQMELLGAATETVSVSIGRAVQNANRFYGLSRQQSDEAVTSVQALIAELQAEAQMRELVVQFGEDSVQVADARATAERKVFVETTNARDVSEELKKELIAAWDAANGVASVDMAGNISLAEREAARLTAQLDQVLTRFTALNPITPAQQDEDALFSQPVLSTSATRQTQRRAVTNFDRILNPKRRSGGSGGNGAAREAEREQKAIDDLIASLDRQNDVLRETDPVQKEMIQNRRVLANATKAEKATVEELIAARIREEEAIARNSERADFYGNILSSALDTASEKGAKLDDVLKNIAGSLLDATIQAAIFGDGPFGGLFGGGSIIDMILPQKKAEGGMIYGPGGPKADKVPVLASAGEFMMNAQATTKYRAVLEAMNAGAPIQALANGGPIGRSASASNADRAPGAVTIHVNVTGANGNTEIMEMVSEGVGIAIERFSDFVLPGRVSEISSNPRRVG